MKTTCLFLLFCVIAATQITAQWRPEHFGPAYEKFRQGDSRPPGEIAREYFKSMQKNGGAPGAVPQRGLEFKQDPGGTPLPVEATSKLEFFGQSGVAGYFGRCVANAGDVNGDGFDDIIIGQPGGTGIAGRAYIYFGGTDPNSVPDVILPQRATNEQFGASVASAGDINGDGYADVIVGAPTYDLNSGAAYVYKGGVHMSTTPYLTVGGPTGSYFGASVSSAGDFNGDGYSDYIVGAYGANSNTGRAYFYLGGSAPVGVSSLTIVGEGAENYFGQFVACAGDVNGDGKSDILISAWNHGGGTGKVYIYYGGTPLDATADVTITGGQSGEHFGGSIASAGDVNGDGFADIIIGSALTSGKGAARLFFGGAAMDATPDCELLGESNNSYFGWSVSGAGDVNGDGYSDVIVGAPGVNASTGKIYVYFGRSGTTMDNRADLTHLGSAAAPVGRSVAGAGDINADGYADYLVGSESYYANQNQGKAFLYMNKLTGNDIPDAAMYGKTNNAAHGFVAAAGDVNGDGYADVMVGAPGFNGGHYGLGTGHVYIYRGGPNFDTSAWVDLVSPIPNSHFGIAIAAAGDVNGDGYGDIIVGADSADYFYIYAGGTTMSNTPWLSYHGPAGMKMGTSVAGIGDINGDGFDDWAVGAYNSWTGVGNVTYFLGTNDPNQLGFSSFPQSALGDNFGRCIAGLGDVNGDGYDDFAIGAPGTNTLPGCVYVKFGGTIISNWFFNLRITGQTSSWFASSIAAVGDVNGDGFPDMLVGAPGELNGVGKAYLYYGGGAMDTIADLTLTGGITSGWFGNQVSGAGDMNGDGYDDFLITTLDAVSAYFGGSTPDAIPDITYSDPRPFFGTFGSSLAGVGDVNKDGLDDIMIGDYKLSLVINDYHGAAYLYLSTAPSVNPVINGIADVPNDQGGFVNLRFARSAYDIKGVNRITGYMIERSFPQTGGSFYWSDVQYIGASKKPFYSQIVQTPSDSAAGGGTYFFRVRTVNATSSEFWHSNILSGHSVDNLAPAAVKNFTIVPSGPQNRLSWKLNTEPDLKQYVIYRNAAASIDPLTATVFATAVDSFYLDAAPLSGEFYYFIFAKDIHNNLSPVSWSPAPNAALNITAFIEGFYDQSSGMQTADTVKVFLRNISAPYAKADSSTAVLNANGLASLKFFNAANGSYYLVISHRNSIETWSKTGGENLAKGSALNYDFSTAQNRAYGNNMVLKGSKWCIFSGDVNQDGIVDYSDLSAVDNDSYNFTGGYVATDVTGDDFVDYTDLAICDNNSFNFVQVAQPGGMLKRGVQRGELKSSKPRNYAVSNNYPNPFNPSTRIDYAIPEDGRVVITLFNPLGQKIREVVNEEKAAGFYSAEIVLAAYSSGTYFLLVQAGDFSQTKKMLLLK